MIIADSVRRSSTPVRFDSRWNASERRTPAWISSRVCFISWARRGATSSSSCATRDIAASSARPASTQVTSRSIESGSASSISACRFRIWPLSHMLGRKNISAVAMTATAIAGGISIGVARCESICHRPMMTRGGSSSLTPRKISTALSVRYPAWISERWMRDSSSPSLGFTSRANGRRMAAMRANVFSGGPARRRRPCPCRRWSRARAAR